LFLAVTMNPSQKMGVPVRHDSYSFRVRSKDVDEDVATQRLRSTLINSFVNQGLLSAFMCALANGIYVNPPEDPKCRGDSGVKTIYIIEWVSMGCFFLVIILTVILASDMDGVPDYLLLRHLKTNLMLYTLPQPFLYVGLMLLACGYGVDLDERIGCPTFRFGTVAAPCFPLLTFAILKYAQGCRRKTGVSFPAVRTHLGVSVFSTWSDLLQMGAGGETGAGAADVGS